MRSRFSCRQGRSRRHVIQSSISVSCLMSRLFGQAFYRAGCLTRSTLCAFRHRGCKCPSDFYGPHCEFLKFSDNDGDMQAQELTPKMSAIHSPATVVILALMSVSIVLLAALIRRKLARRVPSEIVIETQQPTSSAIKWGNGYSDSRYNGRHRSYNSQNLHIQTVWEDATFA